MKEYLDVLQKILDEGVEKESGRPNMPNTISLSTANIKMDLSEGFPLLTTKRMFWKGIVHELLWILRGETNIKYLVDNKVNIWNGDAYRWYLKYWGEAKGSYTQEEFIEKIKEGNLNTYTKYGDWDNPEFGTYKLGDLGKVYGHQWRNQNGVDQVQDVVDGLKKNPYSRYHIIDGWNKADFPDMALPPCHLLYQFIVRPLSFKERRDLAVEYAEKNKKFPLLIDAHGQKGIPEYMDVIDNTGWNIPKFYLDLNMYQRSCDTFLGVPFNIASMSLLLMIMANASNMIAGVANWIGGDTHMYTSHVDAVTEQLGRTPTKLPTVKINVDMSSLEDICELTINNFELCDYEAQPTIKAELFTGLKKK